jgi:endonuclease III
LSEAILGGWSPEPVSRKRLLAASGCPPDNSFGRLPQPSAFINLADVNPQKRRTIYERLRAANPHPTTELSFSTPFELLVAVVLSAQATDKGVNLATRKLFAAANTPRAILALGQAGLEEYVRTIGLYRNKAKNILQTCRLLLERHGGEVPRTREALESLPGVGRKTANVILNTAFGEPTIAVDTHIFRVANRTGLAPGTDVLEVERRLEKFTPDEFKRDAHHWLILHGRYVCVARKPKCPECIISDLCEFRLKTPTSEKVAARASSSGKRRLLPA